MSCILILLLCLPYTNRCQNSLNYGVCGGVGLGVAPPPAVPPGLICVIALGAEKALGHVPNSSPSFHCPRPYWSLPVLAVAPANTGVGSERGSHLCAAIRVLSVHR